MSAPRLEIDLSAVEHNTRMLVRACARKGIGVLGIAKGAAGLAPVARAMLRGGATGLGDSRIENVAALASLKASVPLTMIRSPMPSQVARVVSTATASLNTERTVLERLAIEAQRIGERHEVVLMVELGDLREGIAAAELVDAARFVHGLRGLHLRGIGTNLACHSGVMPDAVNMAELSRLAEAVERAIGRPLAVVSGGNSANVEWALGSDPADRVNELRLGEAPLLGTEPVHRTPIAGLSTEAFTLVGEVIEVGDKPAHAARPARGGGFGGRTPSGRTAHIRQAIVAIGQQDTTLDGLRPPEGFTTLGMSSDHLILEAHHRDVRVGDELRFGMNYAGLLRAATSPYVLTLFVAARGTVREPSATAPR